MNKGDEWKWKPSRKHVQFSNEIRTKMYQMSLSECILMGYSMKITFCKESRSSQTAKCFQLLRNLINWSMWWTDPRSLSAHSSSALWNLILIWRHEYEFCLKAISEAYMNENVIKALMGDTFEILQQETQKGGGWVRCFWTHLHYNPCDRRLVIIRAPFAWRINSICRGTAEWIHAIMTEEQKGEWIWVIFTERLAFVFRNIRVPPGAKGMYRAHYG